MSVTSNLISILTFLVDETPYDVSVGIDAPVAQEGPDAAYRLRTLQVDIDQQQVLPLIARFGQHFPLGTRHKAVSPKADAARYARSEERRVGKERRFRLS